jgi:hypothetical protein
VVLNRKELAVKYALTFAFIFVFLGLIVAAGPATAAEPEVYKEWPAGTACPQDTLLCENGETVTRNPDTCKFECKQALLENVCPSDTFTCPAPEGVSPVVLGREGAGCTFFIQNCPKY